jgi:hypothetical protein
MPKTTNSAKSTNGSKSSNGSKSTNKKTGAPLAEHWKEEPDDHDYPAAGDYLSLLMTETEVEVTVAALKVAPIVRRKAKDLLRASRLGLLGTDNIHVAIDLSKVKHGDRLSPILLVRGSAGRDVALTVADGYHRICASYHIDEDADIPCRIAGAN